MHIIANYFAYITFFIHDTYHFKEKVISYRMIRPLFHLDEYRPSYLHLNSHALAKSCHATDKKKLRTIILRQKCQTLF